jgi:ubiquinone/menaquinone biosynthesis C-methylase UbiE
VPVNGERAAGPGGRADSAFAGSVPKLYETLMVPMIFQSYASDLKERVVATKARKLLELAAGTGVVTRALATIDDEAISIVATDLNQAMLDQAMAVGTARPVTWRQADAMALPFTNGEFDAVVCQFGAMFFPDKGKAFAEARRVLKPGGVFIFNVWDRISENEFADTVMKALETVFPQDPPRFMARTPHGYHDQGLIAADLATGGFAKAPRFTTLPARSRAASARDAAMAYCQGTPMRNEIEVRDASRLAEATDAAAAAIERKFGTQSIEGKIQAIIVAVEN